MKTRYVLQNALFHDGNESARLPLAQVYYKEQEYHLLYFITRDRADPVYKGYLLVALYELGQLDLIRRLFLLEEVNIIALLSGNNLPAHLASQIPEIIKVACQQPAITFPPLHHRHYQTRDYQIWSCSEPGINFTIINTPFGALIFDCGFTKNRLTKEQIKRIFTSLDITIDTILGVFISHAHHDHIAGIGLLIALGIPHSRLFCSEMTRTLMGISGYQDISADLYNVEDFHHPAITVTGFNNGHIYGSLGFIISILGHRIVFTGDFNLTPQIIPANFNKEQYHKLTQMGVEALICETTNGQRPFDLEPAETIKLLEKIVSLYRSVGRHLVVFAPSLGCAQELLYRLINCPQKPVINISQSMRNLFSVLKTNKIPGRQINVLPERLTPTALLNTDVTLVAGLQISDPEITSFLAELLSPDYSFLEVQLLLTCPQQTEILSRWEIDKGQVVLLPFNGHASYQQLIQLILAINPQALVQIHGPGIMLGRSGMLFT